VAWVGRDDNRETGLYGATGAMRVWAALMAKLPTDPLAPDFSADPLLAWVDPQLQVATDPDFLAAAWPGSVVVVGTVTVLMAGLRMAGWGVSGEGGRW
jgi:membrane peptidoglycan carboxypeptidase